MINRTSMSASVELKHQLVAKVDRLRPRLIELSETIHRYAELPFEEVKSSDLLAHWLREAGFHVEKPIANLATAFRASIRGGEPGPKIALCAEYDGVHVVDYKSDKVTGHACGHNLNAAAAIGAAFAVQEVLPAIDGSLFVFGTPAEEGGAGKILLQEAGVWRGIDAVFTFHGDQRDWYTVGRTCTCTQGLLVRFRGRRPSSGRPRYDYVNPLDALNLFFAALNVLDGHVSRETRIQRIIMKGGETPNVVPVEATAKVWLRSGEEKYLDRVAEFVVQAARGASLAVGAEVELEQPGKATERIIQNLTLEGLGRANIEALGLPFRLDEPSPYPFATDFGNLTHEMPGMLLLFGIPGGFAFHTIDAIEQSKSPAAHEAMLFGAKVMAMTALDLYLNPSHVQAAKAELESYRRQDFRTAASWHAES